MPAESAISQAAPPDDSGARIEIEQRLIGWGLCGAPGATAMLGVMRDASRAFEPIHRAIIEAICANDERGLEYSPAAIGLALADNRALAEIGGVDYLVGLARAAPAIVDEQRGKATIQRAITTHRNIVARQTLAQDTRDIAEQLDAGDSAALERLVEIGREAAKISVSGSIVAQPFSWRDPSTIPTREWLFARHAIRGFVSATIAPGGVGKTALAVVEALAVAAGKNILRDAPLKRGRVWYMGLEDPLVEYERRFAAAALHHHIPPTELTGGLFLNAARSGEFMIATAARDGLEICRPIVSAIIENIRKNNIALLIVDPYVASHAVPESDNTLVAAVLREFAYIADETNAAVELIHHSRKAYGAGGDGAADDARGASAFVNATRSTRLLVPMTAEEATRANVDDRRRFFRVVSGKANLAPYSEGGAWRELVSITLRNGGDGPDDHVGAVAAWQMPDASSIASAEDIDAIHKRLADGKGRADSQAKGWAGNVIADVLGLDASDKGAKDSIKRAIRSWLSDGTLQVVEGKDDQRRPREFIVPGDRS